MVPVKAITTYLPVFPYFEKSSLNFFITFSLVSDGALLIGGNLSFQ
jgi:hypothetical protein